MTNRILILLYLHIFDIKASKFSDIGKVLSYTLADTSNVRSWKNYLKLPKNIITGLKFHY